MKIIKKQIKEIITTLVLLFVLPQCVGAVSVSPLTIEFRAKPSETKEFKIKLKNDEKSKICFKLDVEAINKMNADGSPVFDTVAATEAMLPWFSIKEKNICANSGETITPTLVIKIPNDIKPAGYYAAIYFTSLSNEKTETGSSVVNRVGVLMAMRIDGDVILEQAKINQFVYDETNKKFTVDFVNEGTVHLRPYGEIVIKNNDGRLMDTVIFNEAGVLVLPNSSRLFEIPWVNHLSENALATLNVFYGTGPKKAEAVVALKAQAQNSEMKKRLMIIGSLILVALALKYIVKKMRKNNYYV